jgi:hypothetical protein
MRLARRIAFLQVQTAVSGTRIAAFAALLKSVMIRSGREELA